MLSVGRVHYRSDLIFITADSSILTSRAHAGIGITQVYTSTGRAWIRQARINFYNRDYGKT